MSKSRKPRLPAEIVAAFETFAEECRKPSGRFDSHRGSELHQKMTSYLTENPISEETEDRAFDIITRIVDARSLPRHKGQGLLFSEDVIIAVGDGEQIELPRARINDIHRHIGVLTKEMQVSSAAYNEKLTFYSDRLEYMQPEDTFLAVEMRHFGYVPDEAAD